MMVSTWLRASTDPHQAPLQLEHGSNLHFISGHWFTRVAASTTTTPTVHGLSEEATDYWSPTSRSIVESFELDVITSVVSDPVSALSPCSATACRSIVPLSLVSQGRPPSPPFRMELKVCPRTTATRNRHIYLHITSTKPVLKLFG